MKEQSTLEEIAKAYNVSDLFAKYTILYCQDGQRTLHEIAQEKGLSLKDLQEAIEALPANNYPSIEDLPDYIISRFHDKLREIFPEILNYSKKVEQVHQEHILCPAGLHDHVMLMSEEMYSHMTKEENILFPMINQGNGHFAIMPMNVMMQEHEQHCEAIELLDKLTHQFRMPEDACGSWRHLYKLVHMLKAELLEHMFVENYILFKKYLN